jgi:hypothetical protein
MSTFNRIAMSAVSGLSAILSSQENLDWESAKAFVTLERAVQNCKHLTTIENAERIT